MALTRLQIKDYVRAKLSELDSGKVKSAMLDVDINLAIRKVQKDLVSLGIKQFTKTATLTGSNNVAAVPTDMLSTPNAIIDITVDSVKATVDTAFTGDNNDFTITAATAGTSGNNIRVVFAAAGVAGAVAVTGAGTSISPYTITYYCGSESPLASAVKASIEASSAAMALIAIAYKTGNTGAGAISTGTDLTYILTGGVGDGNNYSAKELSIEDYNKVNQNTFLIPTATEPAYNRRGDSSGLQKLYFLPSMTSATINYYYRFADLSADASTNPLPDEYEELVLMDVMAKTYESLKQIAESQNKAVEYETKVKEIETKYRNALAMSQVDKTRIQSNDNP